jgi:hypothetical protein
MSDSTMSSAEHTMLKNFASSGQPEGTNKLNCLVRFDEVNYWLSRTRDLIANAETYSSPAFRESFRKLRCRGRKSDCELVLALYKFERAMREHATDADNK